jgi:hypothetical protein
LAFRCPCFTRRLRCRPRCAAHRRARRDAPAHRTEGGDEHVGVKHSHSCERLPAASDVTSHAHAPPITHPSASVAGSDAPLIGERAQRGRIAMEGDDERGGGNSTLLVGAPAWRTPAANDATRDAHACRTHARLHRRNDAPLIGERAATRRRSAMGCGDAHVGVKSALSVGAPALDRWKGRWPTPLSHTALHPTLCARSVLAHPRTPSISGALANRFVSDRQNA